MNSPLLLVAVLLCQYVVVQLCGRCPLTGHTHQPRQVLPVIATLALAVLLAMLGTGLFRDVVLLPLQLDYLLLFAAILWAALSSQLARLAVQRLTGAPPLDDITASYLLLPAAVIASALLVPDAQGGPTALLSISVAAAAGFALLFLLFAALRERLLQSDVPVAFRGAAIHVITAGMIALALTGLTGVL